MRWFVVSGLWVVLLGASCSRKAPEPGSDSTSGSKSDSGPGSVSAPSDGLMTIRGRLTDEGVECPAMRDEQGILYTLSGDLGSFRPGDQVCVRGRTVEMSICQQGVTIAVVSIAKSCP